MTYVPGWTGPAFDRWLTTEDRVRGDDMPEWYDAYPEQDTGDPLDRAEMCGGEQ